MIEPSQPGRMVATYRLRCDTYDEATDVALAVAREQTLEVPPGVAGDALEGLLLGRIDDIVGLSAGGFDITISYALEVTGTELLQVLNVAYGNVSLMNGVRLVDLLLPPEVLDALPGPRVGIAGLRETVGAAGGRPLVSVAIKPVGRTSQELADLATTFVRAGVDAIKDDHGLVDQPSAPFLERVATVASAVARANAETGRRAVYFPNVTGPVDSLEQRLEHARSAGCAGVMVCPSLMGLDVMRGMASGPSGLAIMAHPTHSQTAPGRSEGIAPDVLYGTIYRVAGADTVVYVNAGGRFAWPIEACEAINARLRAPLGRHRAAMPTPAGGVQAAEAQRWLERYGPDTMLLIGGSLLARDDLLGATRRVVEAAVAATPSTPGS
jgi:ribulose-bisphosphate carboxylase large chain